MLVWGLFVSCSSNDDAGSPAGDRSATGGVAGGGSGNAGAAGNSSGGSGGHAGSAAGSATGTSGAGAGGLAGLGGSGGAAGAAETAGAGGSFAKTCADYLICEDFEATDVGDTPEGWTKHGDATSVDDAEAYRGSRALKIYPIASGQRRIYHDASLLPSSHWGRMYYKVALPVPDAFVHSTMVALLGDGPNVGEAEYRVVDTVKMSSSAKHQFLYNVQPNGPEFGKGSAYDYTFDGEWHCAEWYIDAENQAYRFFYDGDEIITFENGPGNYDDSEIPDGFSELRVGWNNYQSAPPGFTAWLDEIALDDERIGCD